MRCTYIKTLQRNILLAEISGLHALVAEERGTGSFEHDATSFKHIAAIRELECGACVLLDKQDREAASAKCFHCFEDLRNEERRDTHGWFVHHEQLRTR